MAFSRIDTHLANEEVEAEQLDDIFALLNQRVDAIYEENGKEKPVIGTSCNAFL